MKYETRITRLIVLPEGAPIFSDQATTIQIEDEAAGEYIEIEQSRMIEENGKIWIDPEEWPHIREAVESLLREIGKDRQ